MQSLDNLAHLNENQLKTLREKYGIFAQMEATARAVKEDSARYRLDPSYRPKR